MSDTPHAEPGPDRQTQPQPDTRAGSTSKPGAPSGNGRLLPTLGLLGLLGGVAALGVLHWQQRTVLEAVTSDTYALQQRNVDLEQRLAAAEAARASLAADLQALQATTDSSTELAVLRADLEALQRELTLRTASSAEDWSRLEAAALLRLAQQQALAASSLPSAIRLYQQVAELLRRSNDPQLQPVRAAVQLELDALRAVRLPPLNDLYLQLGQLIDQLDLLQVQSDDEAPLRFSAPSSAALPADAGWREQLKQSLGQYFVLQRQDAPILARLTPEQAFLIRQAVALQLESARLALLQGDSTLYRATLDAARDALASQLQGEAKPAMLASIQRLRDSNIAPRLPALGAALQTLERLERSTGTDTTGAP